MSQKRRGIMLVVSSPSGAGKTTLTRELGRQRTQPETVGFRHDAAEAAQRGRWRPLQFHLAQPLRVDARSGELLEWAKVHGNFYGTPRKPVEKALEAGHDVLFDIDWQGTQQLYAKMRADVVSVFVLPPSARELEARLERRAQDSGDTIRRRLQNAADEIPHWAEYDYVLVNRDLDQSFRGSASHPRRGAGQKARPREIRKSYRALAGRPQKNQPRSRE